jgi:hypothetical protein
MDRLQKDAAALVEADTRAGADPGDTFYRVWALARKAAGKEREAVPEVWPLLPRDRHRAPRLSEPWFC